MGAASRSSGLSWFLQLFLLVFTEALMVNVF
jgi:hypothetical protein